jgi:DNA polymerase III alpha subunit (gram-positive type)
MDWINESKSSPDDKVILIAHNAFRFDAPVLINNMLKAGMYCDAIFGFADTLVSFKKLFPELEAYNLKYLMKKFGIVEDQTHEGLQDAKDLREVITRALEVKEVTFEDLVMEGFKEIDEIDLV